MAVPLRGEGKGPAIERPLKKELFCGFPNSFCVRNRRRMEDKRAKLGIMEAVEEVGVEHLLSDRESTPGTVLSLLFCFRISQLHYRAGV